MARKLKIVDMKKINEQIERGEVETAHDDPAEVLYETLLDILQIAKAEGMTEDEVDAVVNRVNDYRANRNRDRFRLHLD